VFRGEQHLILIGAFARRIRSDDYPWAPTAQERERLAETIEHAWPYANLVSVLEPSGVDTEGDGRPGECGRPHDGY
jgi:hypothetical protein